MRQELKVVLQAVRDVSAEDLPTLLGELEQVRYTAIARLSEPTLPALREPGRLLPIEEAANRLSISTDYLYRHADDYSFTRRIGGRLLFSSIGIDQFIASDSSAESRRKGRKPLPGIRTR
jgi:predicted DNA-binding transcriptional regulator AlpA